MLAALVWNLSCRALTLVWMFQLFLKTCALTYMYISIYMNHNTFSLERMHSAHWGRNINLMSMEFSVKATNIFFNRFWKLALTCTYMYISIYVYVFIYVCKTCAQLYFYLEHMHSAYYEKNKNKFTHQWNSILNLQQIFNHILRNFINICESSGVNNLITRLIQIPFGFKRGHCSQFPSIIL